MPCTLMFSHTFLKKNLIPTFYIFRFPNDYDCVLQGCYGNLARLRCEQPTQAMHDAFRGKEDEFTMVCSCLPVHILQVTDEQSFNNIRNWMRQIQQHVSPFSPRKLDLIDSLM